MPSLVATDGVVIPHWTVTLRNVHVTEENRVFAALPEYESASHQDGQHARSSNSDVALHSSGVPAHGGSAGWSAPRWLVNADGCAAL